MADSVDSRAVSAEEAVASAADFRSVEHDRGEEAGVDLSLAERAGRSWVLPQVGEFPDWAIFQEKAGRDNSAERSFEFKTLIRGDLEDVAFVNACYRALLQREADDNGMRSYISMLRQRTLRRRDLILALLGSDEGNSVASDLLVIPEFEPAVAAFGADRPRAAPFAPVSSAA